MSYLPGLCAGRRSGGSISDGGTSLFSTRPPKQMVPWFPSPGWGGGGVEEQAGHVVFHSPASNIEVKNEWNYASIRICTRGWYWDTFGKRV